jgi:hypothetical protein
MKVSKNFDIKELVPREVYQRFGDFSVWFLDQKTIQVLQQLRDTFGTCIVNNWSSGGKFNYSGYRQPDCKVGASFSQHKFGRAFDCKFTKATADEVRQAIQADKTFWLEQGLSCYEDNVSWLHFDTRWTNFNDIFIVKP